MLKIRKTEKIKRIIDATGTITLIGFICQVVIYLFLILAVILKINNDFYLSTVVPILICDLVIPAGLTLLLMVIYTFIMIFMYFKGKFDKLKIEIIEIDRNGNEESSIYSPFNIYTLILMCMPFVWLVLSPIFAGLFIWTCSIQEPYVLIFFITMSSTFIAVFFIIYIFVVLGILCGCCKDIVSRRSLYNPNIPIYSYNYDPNNNYFVRHTREI